MIISLPLHLFIHLALAVLAGFLIGRHYNKVKLGLIAGVLGGFLIDFDHVLEYFFVFGLHFNFYQFLQGQQFLASNRIFLIFHAWEYIPLLLGLAWLLRRRRGVYVFLLALTLGGTVHLATDCLVNKFPPQNYSIIYRWSVNFATPKLLSPEQYQRHLEEKRLAGSV